MIIDPSMPVLIVGEHVTAIHIIRKLLWQIGLVNVDHATDGVVALAKMRAKRYGLVISDWNMQLMTGYAFLRQVRSDPSLKRTPFITVTAESKIDNVIAAKKAGADSHILEPFDARTLKAKIESAFAASGESSPTSEKSIAQC